MNKTVSFKTAAICDECGASGAYDFYGDYYCDPCTDRLMKMADDRDWCIRHGLVGRLLDWLTLGSFAKYVQRDPRPRRLVAQTEN